MHTRSLLLVVVIAMLSWALTTPLLAQDPASPSKTSQDPPSAEPTKSSGGSKPWYSPSRYNPMKLVHPKSANDELASDGHFEDNLSKLLRVQGLMAANTELQDLCSNFRDLATCVGAMHASQTLKIDFLCLKWDVTGTKPKGTPDSCAGPAGGKAMPFERAIDLLKPNSNARAEANTAMNQARNNIRDAKS